MDDQLLENTSELFESIDFSQFNERWIDEVIDNEFTDAEENDMTPSILFTNDPISTLNEICDICEAWCKKSSQMDIDDSELPSFSGNVTSRPEEVLWTYLTQMDISVRQIQVLVYFLCCKALKTSSSNEEHRLGLLSAKFYFSCLKVPGSSAYSVFFPNLFRLCIDALQISDYIDAGQKSKFSAGTDAYLSIFGPVLISLVPLLKVFHLGNDPSTSDHTIGKLSELVSFSEAVNFDRDFLATSDKEWRRHHFSKSVAIATLAFQGLTNLYNSEVNSDREHTYEYILSCLNKHILCYKARKAQTIPAKFLLVKDNCIAFMCRNLKNDAEFCSPLTVTSLKRLCLTVSDKQDFRTHVSQAIFRIMFNLQVPHLADFVQWILRLVDSSEGNNRVFALEVLGQLLGDVPQVDAEELDESLKVYLTPVPIIFAILTRCDDISPNVRTKSLSVLSQHMRRVLNVLKKVEDRSTFPVEDFEEEMEPEMNGDHRSFWYNFDSFRSMLEEIVGMLHRRIEDNNGVARKAALQALESIITFDLEYLSKDNLKLFVLAAKDPNIIMRRQMIQSLTDILEAYHDNVLSQEYWLKCIMPLIQDPENTIQAKVSSVLMEIFLKRIFSNNDEHRNCAFSLLEKLSRGEFLSHQRYLQKAFSLWKREKEHGQEKLHPNVVKPLLNYFGGDKDELLWFYISIFSAFCKLPTRIRELAVQEFENDLNWKSYSLMESILKIVGSTYSSLAPKQLDIIRDILMEKLQEFAAPVEIIPMMIEILGKIEKHLQNEDFAEFASSLIKSSVDILTVFVTKGSSNTLPSDDKAIKCFTIIKELCQMFPTHITPHLLKVLKSFIYSTLMSEGLSQKQSEISKRITPSLRAHAFAALGKICLQDEDLAKDLLPFLAKEVMASKENVIRNNAVIILIEMCKRYTLYADKYLPLISMCFKDSVYLIRYQAITMVVSLLQEDYIKWKGPLFFCLLSTLIDKKEAIQELGKYCLCQLLYEKKKSVFADNFVDCVFVFNHFVPPDNERLAEMVSELERFALRGSEKQEQRMHMYKFMLSYMEPVSRAYLVTSLNQEVLTPVAEAVFPLNDETESMVKDCLAIISSKEIRAFDSDNIANEMEENEEETVANAELVARKIMIVEPVIPVMISLKNCVMEAKSNLLSDIVLFLKDILQDYTNEIDTLLRDDKMLLMQVKYEIRNETMLQEKQAKEKKRQARKEMTTSLARHQIAEKANQDAAYLLRQGRESILNINNGDKQPDVSLRLLPQTPQAKNSQLQSDSLSGDFNPQGHILVSTETGNRLMPSFSSTPRVVLKQLSAMELPNLSRICFEEEDDDD